MIILINASNLKNGGGLQVADSICRSLGDFNRHSFIVVLSSYFNNIECLDSMPNVKRICVYNVKNNIQTLVFGRDSYLDGLVEEYKVDAVLTVFGPSRWNPKCFHLSGFALSFLTMPESPYFQLMSLSSRIKVWCRNKLWEVYFKRSAKFFYTENPMVTERLKGIFKGSDIYTVTNYYNQVFDCPEECIKHQIPPFDGVSLINISTPYPHKNLGIAVDIVRYMKEYHPELNLRFVYTIDESVLNIPEDMKNNFLFIGKVSIEECPSLYQQCDIAFQPTLLESFTASYPEAMRMETPIVTTDLVFARGLCGDAAVYYKPLDARDAAEVIYRVATDSGLAKKLVNNGRLQLAKYDDYNQRTQKLISIIETNAHKSTN